MSDANYRRTQLSIPYPSTTVTLLHAHPLRTDELRTIAENLCIAKLDARSYRRIKASPDHSQAAGSDPTGKDAGDANGTPTPATLSSKLKDVDRMLNGPTLKISLIEGYTQETSGHVGLIRQDHGARADRPRSSHRSPELRMTKASLCDRQRGAELVVQTAAVKSTPLQDYAYFQPRPDADDMSDYPSFTGDPRYRQAMALALACGTVTRDLRRAALEEADREDGRFPSRPSEIRRGLSADSDATLVEYGPTARGSSSKGLDVTPLPSGRGPALSVGKDAWLADPSAPATAPSATRRADRRVAAADRLPAGGRSGRSALIGR